MSKPYQVWSDDMNDETLQTYIAQWRTSREPFDQWFKRCEGIGGLMDHDGCPVVMPEGEWQSHGGSLCAGCQEGLRDDAHWGRDAPRLG